MDGSNKKCICELCTCGKHSCHQTLKQRDWAYLQPNKGGKVKSELPSIGNSNRYIANQRYHKQLFIFTSKCPIIIRNGSNNNTTYKDHYQPDRRVKTEHRVNFKDDNEQISTNHFPFIGSTSYQDHYQRNYDQRLLNILNPERASLQPQYIRPNSKFQGQSTYKSHYIDTPYMRNIRNLNSQKVNRRLYNKQPIPFKGSSTYQDAFLPYIYEVKPVSSIAKRPPVLKFEGRSIYHDDYRGYTIREEIKSRCPVDSLELGRVNSCQLKHLYYDFEAKRFV